VKANRRLAHPASMAFQMVSADLTLEMARFSVVIANQRENAIPMQSAILNSIEEIRDQYPRARLT